MDLSSLVGTLMSADSLQGVGKTSKTDTNTVQSVLGAALPSLLSSAQAQSQDTATGFAEALLSHSKADTSNIASFLGKVDVEDGGKIVNHLLDADTLTAISKKAGVSKKDTKSVLSAAAPLLMSLLGQQTVSSASGSNASAIGAVASMLLQNADMGSLLGGLLGVESNTTASGKKKKPAAGKKQENIALNLLKNLLK